jgi:hypothetical protein
VRVHDPDDGIGWDIVETTASVRAYGFLKTSLDLGQDAFLPASQLFPTSAYLYRQLLTRRFRHTALAIMDEASPFALRSTRNRPRRAMRRGAAERTPSNASPAAFAAVVEAVTGPPRCRCQAAAWKRTRAWLASSATRWGPSTAGSSRSMLGRRFAGTTGTPSTSTLPQGTWAP